MKKQETLAGVRESFEKVKATYADWSVDTPADAKFRRQITTLGVQGLIGAANTQLPDSEERRALVAEMAQWLQEVSGPQRTV